MKLIGISGRARAGKDTLANMLMEGLKEYDVIKTAFAEELKKQVKEHFDLSHEQLYGNLKEVEDKRYPMYPKMQYTGGEVFKCGTLFQPICCWTPREIMQDYGQFMREIDYDYWVKALFKKIDDQNVDFLIITDLRHKNEVAAVLRRGGIHIRIYRDSDEYSKVHNTQHISETALDNYGKIDFEIYNNDTLDDLKQKAKDLANTIKNKIGGTNNG